MHSLKNKQVTRAPRHHGKEHGREAAGRGPQGGWRSRERDYFAQSAEALTPRTMTSIPVFGPGILPPDGN